MTYTKDQAVNLMHLSSDVTYLLAGQPIASKLNVINGADPPLHSGLPDARGPE